jgi:hypothetical protein
MRSQALEPREGTPSPRLNEQQFLARFLSQFTDPAFDPLRDELARVAAAAWDAYDNQRKSPRTRKAGAGFADPDYDLAEDWIAARAAILFAALRHQTRGARSGPGRSGRGPQRRSHLARGRPGQPVRAAGQRGSYPRAASSKSTHSG